MDDAAAVFYDCFAPVRPVSHRGLPASLAGLASYYGVEQIGRRMRRRLHAARVDGAQCAQEGSPSLQVSCRFSSAVWTSVFSSRHIDNTIGWMLPSAVPLVSNAHSASR